MIESDDYIVRAREEEGLQVVHELSCGGMLYLPTEERIVLMSKDGSQESFYYPKGHLKILGSGYPEPPLICALRETHEELGIEELIGFNGFLGNYFEEAVFMKSKERSYKTIMLFGVSPNDTAVEIPESHRGKLIRAVTLDDAIAWVQDPLKQLTIEYVEHIRSRYN